MLNFKNFQVLKFRETSKIDRKIPLVEKSILESKQLCSSIEEEKINYLKQNFDLVCSQIVSFKN